MIGRGKQGDCPHHFSRRLIKAKPSCRFVSRFFTLQRRNAGMALENEAWPGKYHSTTTAKYIKRMSGSSRKLLPKLEGEKLHSSDTLATWTPGCVTLSSTACVCFMITGQRTASLEAQAQTLRALKNRLQGQREPMWCWRRGDVNMLLLFFSVRIFNRV